MKFTLITATFNSQENIRRCLDSISCQQDVDLEHLIVDGGSSDKTLDICSEFQYRRHTKIICSEADQGIYDAWNKALPHITGDWVLFIGSDDWLSSKHSLKNSEEEINELLKNSLASLGFISAACIRPNGSRIGLTPESGVTKYPDFFWYRWKGCLPLPPHPSLLHNAEIFRNGSIFENDYVICGDQKFLWINNCPGKLGWISSVITVHSKGGISESSSYALIHFRERVRMLMEIKRSQPLVFKLMYWIRAQIKYNLLT